MGSNPSLAITIFEVFHLSFTFYSGHSRFIKKFMEKLNIIKRLFGDFATT